MTNLLKIIEDLNIPHMFDGEDLCFPVTATTVKLIESYEYWDTVRLSTSDDDGKVWYHVPPIPVADNIGNLELLN